MANTKRSMRTQSAVAQRERSEASTNSDVADYMRRSDYEYRRGNLHESLRLAQHAYHLQNIAR